MDIGLPYGLATQVYGKGQATLTFPDLPGHLTHMTSHSSPGRCTVGNRVSDDLVLFLIRPPTAHLPGAQRDTPYQIDLTLFSTLHLVIRSYRCHVLGQP